MSSLTVQEKIQVFNNSNVNQEENKKGVLKDYRKTKTIGKIYF